MSPIRHDFRSDTVTRPSPAMRAAMAAAEVGDDVFGDDPTVQRLEAKAAEMLGKEAALYLPSGTQSNLVALDDAIAGGATNISSARWPIAIAGRPAARRCSAASSRSPSPTSRTERCASPISPRRSNRTIRISPARGCSRSRIRSAARCCSLAYMAEATALARAHGLACHLDGARAFNAATALGVSIAEVAAPFDTISVCLSKGLGAPIGSTLVGSAALIAKARRIRKMVGGGLRQVGVIAAAGLYALEHNVARLADDHANARRLAARPRRFSRPHASSQPDTNIVFVDVAPDIAARFRRLSRREWRRRHFELWRQAPALGDPSRRRRRTRSTKPCASCGRSSKRRGRKRRRFSVA